MTTSPGADACSRRPSSWSSELAPARRRPGLLEAGVLPPIVLEPLPGLETAPPALVLEVPGDRAGEPVVEARRRRPAQRAELGAVDRVAAVVAGSVGDEADKRGVGADELDDAARQREVVDFMPPADVVDLPRTPGAERKVDAGTVVLDVQPVAHVATVAVDRERGAVDGVGDEATWTGITFVDAAIQGAAGDANFAAKFKLTYDDNNIYVLVDVTDPTPNNDGSSTWQSDCVELFFAMDTNTHGTYQSGDWQIRKLASKAQADGGID